MRIPDSLVEKLLEKTGKFNAQQLKGLHEQAAEEKRPFQDIVIKTDLLTEKDLTKLYAEEIDVPFVELKAADIKADVLKLLPEKIARQYNAVVFDVETDGVKMVAMQDPDDVQAVNFLRKQLGNKLKISITTASLLQSALDQYRGENISSELTKVISGEDVAEEEEEVDENDLAEDSPVAQTVNILIEYAIKSNASDIHIEPRRTGVLRLSLAHRFSPCASPPCRFWTAKKWSCVSLTNPARRPALPS
jgi:type IV pilus assembly protein PilB